MKHLHNNKGQGMTEYVVILALIITLIIAFFPTIKTAITEKSEEIAGLIKNPDKK